MMHELRVGVVHDTPETYGCYLKMPKQHCKKPGYEIEVFHQIMTNLGYDYKLISVDQHGYQDRNGTWTGLIGMIINNQLDVSASGFRVTAQRREVVDFIFPISFFSQVFSINTPDEYKYSEFVMKPFPNNVWLFFASVVFLSICVYMANELVFQQLRTVFGAISAFFRHLWNIYAMVMKNWCRMYPDVYVSNEMLTQIWTCTSIATICVYLTYMQSLLSVPVRLKIPFKNTGQLADAIINDGWTLLSRSPLLSTVLMPYCIPNDCIKFNKALKKRPPDIAKTATEFEMKAHMKKYTYWAVEDAENLPNVVSYNVYNSDGDQLLIRDDTVSNTYISFIFRKNSPLREAFNEQMIKLFQFAQDSKKRYRRPYPKLEDTSAKMDQISLSHLFEVYRMLFIGLFVSFIVFLIELVLCIKIRL